ncbi:MAG: protein translocase subunit SecD [Candidatus Hydrogenedentota bacterium]
MQKHTYRTILIWAVIVFALFQVYPTVGWMTLSEEEREARMERWEEEDLEYHEPSLIGDTWRSVRRWAAFDRDRVITLGLDLQGGIDMVLGLDMEEMDEERRQEYLDQGYTESEIVQEVRDIALQRIRDRVEEFEAREPVIRPMGDDQIHVQLPGEQDIERAQRLVTRTAFLTFHSVAGANETEQIFQRIEEEFPEEFEPFVSRPGFEEGVHQVPVEHIERVRDVLERARDVDDLIPEDKQVALSQPPNAWEDPFYQLYVLDEEPLMTGEGLRMAMARPDQEGIGAQWQVLFENDAEASQRFGQVTEQLLGEPMAIVLDGRVVSAPTIQSPITSSGQITGDFTQEEAQDLAIALNSGSMPVPIREEFTGVVGASLGADSVQRGVTSALIGLAIVLVFMIVYYRRAGLVANIGLLLNALFVLGCFAYFNFTLTLPGVAGFILTIGMAVDANVLIFERIREELRNGKSLLSAVDSGYSRATVTILDANVTTLIAAVVLMQFGTGPIEGFAIALSVGVVCSVFTALVVTRAIFDVLLNREWLRDTLTMMSFFKPESEYEFMGRRKIAAVVSGVAIIAGLATFAYRGEDNLGVDFTSGTNMVVDFQTEETIGVGTVRSALLESGFREPMVQEYEAGLTGHNRFMIRIGEGNLPGSEEAEELSEAAPGEEAGEGEPALEGEAGDDGFVDVGVTTMVRGAFGPLLDQTGAGLQFDRIERVGAAIGGQLRWDAIRALTFALIFIVAYLWFRFQLTFALGAVAALVHDILVTVGLFALTGREFNLPVVAALLTIIGYSLNDTIIVYDRIREDMRLYRGRGMTLGEIMNLSINQTLGRTLMTSMTTLFVLLVLFIFGGPVINDFAFALIAGVIVGTYSSIFVASPMVHFLSQRQAQRSAAQSGFPSQPAKGEDQAAPERQPRKGRYKRKKPRKKSEELESGDETAK